MELSYTPILDLLIFEPRIFKDSRGYFFESWNSSVFTDMTGRKVSFCQDNCSKSRKDVIRGLHYQIANPQAKLVSVVRGAVLDVVVDLRRKSATFGQHFTIELTAENRKMLWVPEGFAHGFRSLVDGSEVFYKVTKPYDPADERVLRWDDPTLGVDWQSSSSVAIVSAKDQAGNSFGEAVFYD